jgi:peroxiredoxin
LIYNQPSKDGTSTREWTFKNIDINSVLPDSQFSYVAPKDATSVDPTLSSSLLNPGAIAPDFIAYNKDGKEVKLSDYRGKTVILDFWATWCWPCNQSLPKTDAIGAQYSDKGVVVLAVAIRDSKTGFDEWLKKHSYQHIQFVRDPDPQGKDAASTLFGVDSTPTAYVIDPKGQVVESIEGYSGSSTELASAVSFSLSRNASLASAK